MTARLRLALFAALLGLAPSLAPAQQWPSDVRRTFIDESLQEAIAAKNASPVRERSETLSWICGRRVFR